MNNSIIKNTIIIFMLIVITIINTFVVVGVDPLIIRDSGSTATVRGYDGDDSVHKYAFQTFEMNSTSFVTNISVYTDVMYKMVSNIK